MKLQQRMLDREVWQSCVNCADWSKIKTLDSAGNTVSEIEQCGRFNQIPPVKVIVVGCKFWDYDIPF